MPDDTYDRIRRNVLQEDCDARIEGVYEAISSKLCSGLFWKVFMLVIGVAITSIGALWGMSLSHVMNGEAHIDPRYPPVTQAVFEDFRTEQRKHNEKQNLRHEELIKAIKNNGY